MSSLYIDGKTTGRQLRLFYSDFKGRTDLDYQDINYKEKTGFLKTIRKTP
jgi:hypothetical protein